MHFYFYFLPWEFIIHFLLLSTDTKGKFVTSSLSARKILQRDVLLQSVMAVVVFFTETSSKPNWTPHIVNWIVTQFSIGGQYGIGFGGRRWSGATRPRPFSKQLTVQKHGMQCLYFCSNSYLRFAASVKRNFPLVTFYQSLDHRTSRSQPKFKGRYLGMVIFAWIWVLLGYSD